MKIKAVEMKQKLNVSEIIEEIFGNHLHPKQKDSLGYAALGILESVCPWSSIQKRSLP